MAAAAPSGVVAKRFDRTCGAPSMIQCAGIGTRTSSASAGTAITTGCGTAISEPLRRH